MTAIPHKMRPRRSKPSTRASMARMIRVEDASSVEVPVAGPGTHHCELQPTIVASFVVGTFVPLKSVIKASIRDRQLQPHGVILRMRVMVPHPPSFVEVKPAVRDREPLTETFERFTPNMQSSQNILLIMA